jgi:hypothetical protein
MNVTSNSVCALAWNVPSTQKFEQEIRHRKKRRPIWNDGQAHVCLQPINLCDNSRCIATVSHCVYFAKGEKEERQLTCHFFPWITGTETNMLLIIFLGLIAKLASLCDGCDIGTSEVNNFDWNQVDISVNTRFLNHQPSIILLGFIYHLWFH